MYFILNVCYIPFIPLSSKSSTFFQIFRGRNEFLPLSSTRPEESHFFRKKLNPDRNTSSVGDMLNDLNWQTLEIRRKNQRLTMMYKIHNNLVGIDRDNFLEEKRRILPSHTHCYQYQIPVCTKPRIITTTRSSPEQQGSGTNCLMLFTPQQ